MATNMDNTSDSELVDGKSVRRRLYEAANSNGYITFENAATIAEQHIHRHESAAAKGVDEDALVAQLQAELAEAKKQIRQLKGISNVQPA